MKDYDTSKIRNICLLSHGGAGKTSLAEAIMFNTGALDRLGKVTDGNTTCDYDQEEIRRNISINTAMGPCEWKDSKINLIDTPGYFDFVGEVMQGIRVADNALIVVPAKDGIEVGTEKSWTYATERKIPKMFFISKMDEDNANFNEVYNQLINTFGKRVIAFQLPIIEGGKFVGVVDVLNMSAKKIDGDKLVETEVPEDLKAKIDELKELIKEGIAETSEELMEKYFGGEEFTPEEVNNGINNGIMEGSIVPVFCGAAMQSASVQPLMDAIVNYTPSPESKPVVSGKKPGTDERIENKVSADSKLSAIVFKTIADPFVGKISMFRVYSGTIKSNSVVYNSVSQKQEKIAQLFIQRGKKQINVDKLVAGDIGAVAKLQNTNTNDTLCDKDAPIILDEIIFPEPVLSMAVEPKAKGDEEKISQGLQRLQDEDPTFKVEMNTETKQLIISGIGEQHLDVIVSKLKSKFNVSVNLKDPKIPYRETIRKKIKVEGKHKKQSGGHGQYGHVWIEFEPGEEIDLTFEQTIFGGAVPRQYFPAVEKGLREAIQKGVLAGYPVVNLKATLVDGSYHDVDSSEMSFKLAARIAYKKGLPEASPVLLEPIAHVEVFIPNSYMGDVIGDLNKRRGRILGMNPAKGDIQQVVADVPEAEMFKYATDLRSMTQGRGAFKLWFERYEEAPVNIAQKIIETAKKELSDDEDD